VCTLSWLPSRNGYWLLFTRDERRSRSRGSPPAVARRGDHLVLAPTDGDFEGTWIGVNSAGVGAALLNRYADGPTDPGIPRVSRGLLVRSLLDSRSATRVVRRLEDMSLAPFQSFTLAATDRRGVVHVTDWDGSSVTKTTIRQPGLLRTSSGGDQLEAERQRRKVFDELVGTELRPRIESLREFHRGHLPERGPYSVCMHRDEAETHSLTEVRVSRRTATMRFLAGPACRDPVRFVRTIPLVR